MTIACDRSRAVRDGVVGWWRRWRQRAASLTELELLSTETDRVARDAGVGVGDLRVLAGKWPDAAHLADRRMATLGLDAAQVGAMQPAVMRDVQRVCSLCANKRVCEHDLDRSPADAAWREYCPNVDTLDALRSPNSTPDRNVK
jgi:Family of unknown function (DUF6455)